MVELTQCSSDLRYGIAFDRLHFENPASSEGICVLSAIGIDAATSAFVTKGEEKIVMCKLSALNSLATSFGIASS